MIMLKKAVLSAFASLALVFTVFSCSDSSSSGSDDGGDSSSSVVVGQSSSSEDVSSSSAVGEQSSSSEDVSSSSAVGEQSSSSEEASSSSVEGEQSSSSKENTFTDARDGQVYEYVTIGTQTWMAENLNYNASGSVCYDNDPNNCATYGRLYDWTTAMAGAASSSATPSEVQGICPNGWHLPSDAEWDTLTTYVGGASAAGTKLKSTSGWNENGNGTDDYDFSALPGGNGTLDGSFPNAGSYGIWWSATEYNSSIAKVRYMRYDRDDVVEEYGNKAFFYQVRCVRD